MSADVAPRALRQSPELASLALPAIGQQLVAALLFVTDRALVGRLGPTPLASLHAATTITWTAMSLLSAVAIGAMAAVGRRSGAHENASAVVKHALVLAVVLALLVVAPLWVARATLAAALAPPDQAIVDLAVDYLEIALCAVPFAAVSAAASACLQARGDARTPFAAGAAAALVNLVVSGALVQMIGVRGAAIGTAIALGTQCAWLGTAMRSHWSATQHAQNSGMGRATAAAFAEKIVFHAGYLAYAGMIAALGSAATAANQAVLGLEALGYPIAEGFAVCAAVLVARKLGADRPRDARRAAATAALIAASCLSGFAVVLLLVPDVSLHLFTSDSAVAAAGRDSLAAAALAQPFMAVAIVSMAALRGAGRGLTALSITLVSGVGVRLGATWLFGFVLDLGLTGAWLASGMDWVVQALVAAFVLHRDRRHSKLDGVMVRVFLLALLLAGCQSAAASTLGPSFESLTGALAESDLEGSSCRIAIARAKRERALPGVPALDERRVELLGRVRGEPVVFTKAPISHEQPVSTARTAGGRVRELVRRFNGAALREVLLRDGYLYSEDPVEALALVREVELDDLFDEPHIWLLRGDKLERLERHPVRRRFEYRFSDGEPATLLLFDRVATHPTALRKPLHRDIRALKQRAGFDRLRVVHMTERALVAELTFGKERVTGLIQSDGARLDLSCFDAPPEKRRAITRHLEATEGQREALAKLQAAAEALVREHMPFDRPREVEDHLSDGELRPLWEDAYRHGRQGFQHEEKSYLVFDEKGRPTPPQTCVAMILDAYERASGRWYRPRGEKAGRTDGRLDFTELGIGNRAGVISFEEFAGTLPKLFETYRFEGKERILFRDRKRFFEGIMAHERAFLPGDIIAIHGPKPDGYIHQHAILIVDTDPLTGFPYLMVDQMRLPRFRTFEGIMAEAPLRSLFYQVRPKAELWALLKTPPNPPPTGGVSRLGP